MCCNDTVMCIGDYRRDMDWKIGFIGHLYTQLGATFNTSAIVNLYTLQFTAAPAKPIPACCVFNSRSLAKASNSGDSLASLTHIVRSPTLVGYCLPAISTLTLNPTVCFNCNLFSISQSIFQLPTPETLSIITECRLSTNSQSACDPRYIASGRTQQKTPFPLL
jgi:hypothetical protein